MRKQSVPFVYAFVLRDRPPVSVVPGSVLDGWSRDPVFDALQTTKPERNEAGTRRRKKRRRNEHRTISSTSISLLTNFTDFKA